MTDKKIRKFELVILFYILFFIVVISFMVIKGFNQVTVLSQIQKITPKSFNEVPANGLQVTGTFQMYSSGSVAGKLANVNGHELYCVEKSESFAKDCREGVTAAEIAKLNNTQFEVHSCPHSRGGNNPYPITSMPFLVPAATMDIPDNIAYIISQPGYNYNNADDRKAAQNAIWEFSEYQKGPQNIKNNYPATTAPAFPVDASANNTMNMPNLEPGESKRVVELSTESSSYATFHKDVQTTYGTGGVKVVDIDETNNENIEAWVNYQEGTITLRTI